MRIVSYHLLRIAVLVASLRPAMGYAGPLPDRFTLSKCVPANCWMYVHGVHNPEHDWIDREWAEVFQAFKESGVDREIVSLIMSVLSEEDRATAQKTIDKVTALIQGVRWGDLVDREFLFAERSGSFQFGFDYIAVAQGKAGSGEANATGLVAILNEAATATGSTVNKSQIHEVDVWELTHPEIAKMGLSIALFRRQDTLGLVTGRTTIDEVIGLLTGKIEAKSLPSTPRFQEALALVKAPEDSIGFFDFKALATAMRTMLEGIITKKEAPGAVKPAPDSPEAIQKAQAMALVQKVLAQLDVLDYAVSSAATKGHRQLQWHAMRVQSGKENMPFAAALLNRKPFEKFDQFIPVDATGFSLSGTVDFGLIYATVLDFIQREVPGGGPAIQQWNSWLASVGFDPKADLFDWMSGEMISIDMPPAIVTPMGGSDSVAMVRVKNPELAKAKLDAFVNFAKGLMQGQGQMLMISPAKVNAEGFREITHPAVAMFLKPVIGVQGDWLMIGTSSAALNKCLDVAAGKAPSITKNPRFSEEGLIPNGPVQSASFEDTSNSGQELGAAIGMIGMFGGMAVAGMPEAGAEERKVKQIFQSSLNILMKLAPVLQKIDFYSSASSVGTYDGKRTLHTEAVTTYKKSKLEGSTAKKETK